ncbi:MAG TPA: hypothetical protein VF411_11385 [Bacteroidia bacterium]
MKHSLFILFLFVSLVSFAQKKSADTLYLMNGRIVVAPVLDTNLFSATIIDPEDSTKRMSIESETMFAIKFHNGGLFYYYQEDTVRNWFTRDEMWLFMQGERDAKKGFKPWGAFYGSMACGLVGGASGLVLGTVGTFFGPVVPIAFFTTVGIPKVRIKHNTVTTPTNLDYDVYILGYEREARAKRRRYSMVGGGIGVALGYIAYFSLRNLVLK